MICDIASITKKVEKDKYFLFVRWIHVRWISARWAIGYETYERWPKGIVREVLEKGRRKYRKILTGKLD